MEQRGKARERSRVRHPNRPGRSRPVFRGGLGGCGDLTSLRRDGDGQCLGVILEALFGIAECGDRSMDDRRRACSMVRISACDGSETSRQTQIPVEREEFAEPYVASISERGVTSSLPSPFLAMSRSGSQIHFLKHSPAHSLNPLSVCNCATGRVFGPSRLSVSSRIPLEPPMTRAGRVCRRPFLPASS